ncbi:hypothetical protein DBV15_11164 [Temnothorax longispinosus]|uniref:Uncharacterized protein n=1 Tax=Temnothorax longispinosus TaxID=300112 RepID=A0A4S2L1P6_9HYME|nr:hypothetical protein DBV15_11164 [Temnothorax longispinosus]
MERRVPERRRKREEPRVLRFSAGFTDRRRTLRGMMRDRIPHEHAGQTKEWRGPKRCGSKPGVIPPELNYQKANVTSIARVFIQT